MSAANQTEAALIRDLEFKRGCLDLTNRYIRRTRTQLKAFELDAVYYKGSIKELRARLSALRKTQKGVAK